MPKAKVAILITTYNRLGLLKKTLKSLEESLKDDKNDVTLFIVDDHSTDGTSKFLYRQRWFIPTHIQTNDHNGGLGYSLNKGLEYPLRREDYSYISYTQDDVVFKPGWLQDCIDCWERFEKLNKYNSLGYPLGFITGHDAPEHPSYKNIAIDKYGHFKMKRTCRATHLFASAKRWKEFGKIPELTPGLAAPKFLGMFMTTWGMSFPIKIGSMVDWWFVGHPEGKYQESLNSIKAKNEWVLCLPGLIKHTGHKAENSTWNNENWEHER